MTPRERKARNEAYLSASRDIVAMVNTTVVLSLDEHLEGVEVYVHNLPDVNETVEQDGAYVECLVWVPANRLKSLGP